MCYTCPYLSSYDLRAVRDADCKIVIGSSGCIQAPGYHNTPHVLLYVKVLVLIAT